MYFHICRRCGTQFDSADSTIQECSACRIIGSMEESAREQTHTTRTHIANLESGAAGDTIYIKSNPLEGVILIGLIALVIWLLWPIFSIVFGFLGLVFGAFSGLIGLIVGAILLIAILENT